MTGLLEVERSVDGETGRLVLRGKVTVSDAPGLRAAILDALGEAGGGLVLDLGEVTAVDSSGVAVLVEGWKRARETGRSYVLEDPGPAVMRVLELSQLDRIFEIRSSA